MTDIFMTLSPHGFYLRFYTIQQVGSSNAKSREKKELELYFDYFWIISIN